ncbi:MAG: carboxypeptidase-like regulatory domain-containing protein [Bacteroidetes bacterium]|nr:carboxypeptidase-like regulatory domain-containing protein [Bacteroidota bacterium]
MHWCILLYVLICSLTFFSLDVSGRVVDGMHLEPLIGVDIHVKGSLTGTVTDHDGWFSLAIEENIETIQISYVGYQSYRRTVHRIPQLCP